MTLDHALMGAGTRFHPPPEHTFVRPEAVSFRLRLRPYDAREERAEELWKHPLAFPNPSSQ